MSGHARPTRIAAATRERVLRLVAEGRSEREVARAVGISRSSVWAIKQAAKA